MKKIFTLLVSLFAFVDATFAQETTYSIVGTALGWNAETDAIDFEKQDDGTYTATLGEIYGEWKIIADHAWTTYYGGGSSDMRPGNTYTLELGASANASFKSGITVKNAKLTLTISDDQSTATVAIEGNAAEEHTYGLVGEFQSWNTATAAFLTQQTDGSWTTSIKDFPGGEAFKVSIDKTWTCFLAQDAITQLEFAQPYTCARGDNNNNFTIGETGKTYNVDVKLVVADDAQSADLTITETSTGIVLLQTTVGAKKTYSLDGRKLSAPQKGVNIIDGKKVLVK